MQADWVELEDTPYKYEVCSKCGEYISNITKDGFEHYKKCNAVLNPCYKYGFKEVCNSCEYRFVCHTTDDADKKRVAHVFFPVVLDEN